MLKSILIGLVILSIAGLVFYGYQIFTPVSGAADKKPFVIAEGTGAHQISNDLSEAGLIRSKFWFETYVWQKKLDRSFPAGLYELSASMNIMEIAGLLTKPGGSEKNIIIIEGWDNKQLADYLATEGLFAKEQFLQTVGRNLSAFKKDYDFLQDKPDNADLEGYLFPDTYRIFKNATVEQIVRKMLDNFNAKLTLDLRQEITKQNKSIFEILTMASILEKEVKTLTDKQIVADIFYKRLASGIALQSDATVNYITGKGVTQPSLNDLSVESPYNTYKNRGLPPGPIANPGIESIEAAIYPTANVYYYFLTTNDGQVIYSKTYEEHLANKRKYLSSN